MYKLFLLNMVRISLNVLLSNTFLVLFFIFLPLPLHASSSTIVINEVLYDPIGPDSGYEWIELRNNSVDSIDINGWTIQAGGTSFTTKATLPSFIVEPYSIILIGEPNVSNADITVSSLAFQNGGSETDGIRIVDEEGRVIDTVLYDEPNSNNLSNDSLSVWTAFPSDCPEGTVLARPSTVDTDSPSDFVVSSYPSPGIENTFPPIITIEGPESATAGTSFVFTAHIEDFITGEVLSSELSNYRYEWTIDPLTPFDISEQGSELSIEFPESDSYTISLTVTSPDNSFSTTTHEVFIEEIPETTQVISIQEAKTQVDGSEVIIVGTVTASPGILFSSEGYVQDETGGIRIKVSDIQLLVENVTYGITGVRDEVYGEPRIVVSSAIEVSPPMNIIPYAISQPDTPHHIASLVKLTLTIKSKRGLFIDAFQKDENISIPIYLSKATKIPSSVFTSGETYTIVGILSRYGTNSDGSPKIRLMPQRVDDIIPVTNSKLAVTGTATYFYLWGLPLLLIVIKRMLFSRHFQSS